MKALVTGSMGFLGRHFAGTLVRAGWRVQGVDIAAPEPWDARDFFRFGTTRFDLAIHCAAVVGGRQKIEGAPLDLAVDLSLDAELFQWAVRTKPGRLVYISSSAAYPIILQGDWLPLSRRPPVCTCGLALACHDARCSYRASARWLCEKDINLDDPAQPDHLYGWSKLTGEILARHAREAGVPVTVVRPFSGYGADQDPTYPFRAFVERARRREDPFVVWGDGRQVRDFIHVDDIVDATLHLAEAGIDGPVNLGTGRPTSFNELAAMVCAAVGYEPVIEHQSDKPVGVRYRVAEPTLLLTHYQPRVSLEEGIRAALATAAVA